MEIFNLRAISSAESGKAPVMESSLLKIKGSIIRQKTSDLLRKAIGPQALPYISEQFDEGWNQETIGPEYAGPLAKQYFIYRKISIYGGSNEIQKNIVAKSEFRMWFKMHFNLSEERKMLKESCDRLLNDHYTQ